MPSRRACLVDVVGRRQLRQAREAVERRIRRVLRRCERHEIVEPKEQVRKDELPGGKNEIDEACWFSRWTVFGKKKRKSAVKGQRYVR